MSGQKRVGRYPAEVRERARMKQLEKENNELRRANEMADSTFDLKSGNGSRTPSADPAGLTTHDRDRTSDDQRRARPNPRCGHLRVRRSPM